jgi:RimJ/RimL family protein N-acetyltransferase
MTVPTLTTPRLTLRAFRAADWDDYSAMNADPAVREFLGGRPLTRQQTWEMMESFLGQWALRGYGLFAVEHQGHFAGRVGILHFIDWPEPELAWTLAAPFWGQGLATEAARRVRAWAFGTLGWDRLVSFIADGNVRSRRVVEKLGAVRQGSVALRGTPVPVWVHPTPGRGVVA